MTKNPTGTNVPTPKPKTSAKKPAGITFLNSLVKETTARSKYYYNEEEFFEYNKIFSKEVRDNLLAELVDSSYQCKQNNINYLKTEAEFKQYAHFLMIKHFSSFGKMLEGKDINYHIQIMNNMYKTGVYDLFFNDIFNQDEVQGVIEQLDLIESLMKNYLAQVKDEKIKVEGLVLNKEVLDKALPVYEDKLN